MDIIIGQNIFKSKYFYVRKEISYSILCHYISQKNKNIKLHICRLSINGRPGGHEIILFYNYTHD